MKLIMNTVRVWGKKTPIDCWKDYKLVQTLWIHVGNSPKAPRSFTVQASPAITLLGTRQNDLVFYYRNTHSDNLSVALCTAARKWKQPVCPLANKLTGKMWCTHTMEYYSAIKKNETCWQMQIYDAILHKMQMQETRKYYIEWGNPDPERWMLNVLTCGSQLWIFRYV